MSESIQLRAVGPLMKRNGDQHFVCRMQVSNQRVAIWRVWLSSDKARSNRGRRKEIDAYSGTLDVKTAAEWKQLVDFFASICAVPSSACLVGDAALLEFYEPQQQRDWTRFDYDAHIKYLANCLESENNRVCELLEENMGLNKKLGNL